MEITNSDALIVVDVQNDFCPGGALAVPDGNLVVPAINRIASRFRNVILTQDWHPASHVSFASGADAEPFSTASLPYGQQVMWPDHCVQGTPGAAFHPDLDVPHAQLVIRKGYRAEADSYSAFKEADGVPTGLAGYLLERGVGRLFVAGLATDFCVAWTAIDGVNAGFDVTVIEDACRGIDVDGSVEKAWTAMEDAGVGWLPSADFSVPGSRWTTGEGKEGIAIGHVGRAIRLVFEDGSSGTFASSSLSRSA